MKVLLVGLKVGAGLESICFSVQNALNKHKDVETQYVDIYGENPKMAKYSSENYYKMVKHFPRTTAFGQRFAYEAALRSKKKHFFINSDVKAMKIELKKYVERYQPDLIFTPLNTVAAALDELVCDGMNIKYVFQMPDFLVAYYTQQLKHCHMLISSCEEVTDILVKKGVPKEKITTLGVPIAAKFYEPISRENALKSIGIKDGKYVLISNGGAGFADNLSLAKYLYDKIGDYTLIIVNGRNEISKKKIDGFIAEKSVENIVNLGFVSNMHEIMKISDIMVGKSGSSSICEASACKLKFIVFDNKLFPEALNIKFLKRRNAAPTVKNKRQILRAIRSYADGDDEFQKKYENFVNLSPTNISGIIAEKLVKIASE